MLIRLDNDNYYANKIVFLRIMYFPVHHIFWAIVDFGSGEGANVPTKIALGSLDLRELMLVRLD